MNFKMAATLMVCGAFMCSSCIGSFGLWNKMLNWNQGIGDKFVNELVFIAFHLIPVYEICYLADTFVLNTVEFWSGSNPVASIGEVKQVKGQNGNYTIETIENGYNITKEGEATAQQLVFNQADNSWNVVVNGESAKLFTMNGNGTASVEMPNGDVQIITLDAQGINQLSQATGIALN